MVLGIEGKARRCFAVAQRIVRGDLHGFGVNNSYVVFVFDIDINVPLAVGCSLFGCAAQINGADDIACLGVDHSSVGSRVTQYVNAPVERVIQHTVWIALRIDGLNYLQRLAIEHRDGLTGREAVMRLGVHSCTVRADIGNLANGSERIEIEHVNPFSGAGAGDVEAAAIGIGVDIIEAAVAADFHCLQHAVLAERGGGEES